MSPATLPVGTVTFVFTDIEGSTRLVQELGAEMHSVVEAHNQLLADTISREGGVVVRTAGDEFFCVFASAPRAIATAVVAQRALASYSWPGGVAVRVRMGIHTGEGVLGGDDYVGLDVHRAARIGSAGHGGQVLLSQSTRELVSEELPRGVGLRDLGAHELKDLGRPERLHQLVVDGLRSEFPPVRSVRVVSSRLPTLPTSFIGRGSEMGALTGLLGRPGLVTLLGPGGSGKTRLAIESARMSSTDFAGFHFVDLTAIADPTLLPSFVAAAMSITDSAGTPADELVAAHVATSRYLLVVDNCEHVIGDAAVLIGYLLERCPRLTVLATSREPLDIPGEQVLQVDGLTTESEGAIDAVQLFVERAAAVAPHFRGDRWRVEIEELCRHLDGMPLAIELAAARATVLTPRDILDRLGDRFALLRSRSPVTTPRHRSLEAAIGWSYDSLPPEEQSFLRRLSVFRGGFTLQAIETVCVVGDRPAETSALDLLSALVAKSFVTFRPTTSGARYELLESIREYAAVQLVAVGEATAATDRHRDYFVEWAKHQTRRLSGSEQLAALEELEADHDNLRAVIARGVEHDDRQCALAMAATLVWFWYVHSHFTEGNYWSSRLLDDRQEAPSRALVRLLIGAGDFDFRIGEHDRAAARFGEALRGARRLGSESLAMWALAYMATNDALCLRLDEACISLEKAAAIADESGDFLAAGYCTFMDASVRGWMAIQDDEPELLPPLLEKLDVLAGLVRTAGERNMIGHVLQAVGLMAHWMGRHEQARGALEESLTAFAEINTKGCASHCLEAVALAVAESHPSVAVELLAGSDSIRQRLGIKAPPLERELRTLATESARASLATDDLAAAGERGRDLTLAEATALARQVLAEPLACESGVT